MFRSIVHLDADAFFASVEQAADPRLRGKAVAVGGEKRGIIASASYEARKLGVYTPMPTARARKLCPKLIVLPGDFEKYERFSRWMFSYAYDFTPEVEITSIDEGYFDLSGARRPPVEIADTIRQAIRQSLKISVSEGIASNKLVSQIASKLHKPAAFASVPQGQERPFLQPLPNHWLPGIGPQTATRLNAAGLARIGQVAATPVDLLHLLVGGLAATLRQFANGIDERPLLPVRDPAKSYSRQETFAADTTDEEYVEAWLRRMADQLMATVRADHQSIRTVTVKVRYNDMAEDQVSESLVEPTDLETDLYSRLRPLLRRAWKRRVSLRMVSLKFSNLYAGVFRVELPLEASSGRVEARRRLAAALDDLRRARGPQVILRGHDFVLREERGKEGSNGVMEQWSIDDSRTAGPTPCASSLAPQASPTTGRTTDYSARRTPFHEPGWGRLVPKILRQPTAVGDEPSPLRFIVPMPGAPAKGAPHELSQPPPGFGLRQPSGALAEPAVSGKAAEDCRSPRCWRACPDSPKVQSLKARRSGNSHPVCTYVPLNVHSYYSFLNSTLSIKDLIQLAKQYELPAMALTDTGNLHGAVEFFQSARQAGLKPILGAEIMVEGSPLRLLVENAAGYRNLCQILSGRPLCAQARDENAGFLEERQDASDLAVPSPSPRLRQGEAPQIAVVPELRRGEARPSPSGRGRTISRAMTNRGALDWHQDGRQFSLSLRERAGVRGKGTSTLSDHTVSAGHPSSLDEFTEGLLALSPDPRWAPLFPGRFYQEISSVNALRKISPSSRLPLIASLPIHYGAAADRWKYDVVQSIRTRTLLRQEHPEKQLAGDFHFHSPAEMRALFKDHPELLARTVEIAERCAFDLPLGKPQFPAFTPPDGSSARAYLRTLVLEGLRARYPERFAAIQPQVETELAIISAVGYEEYFLVVWDLLQTCRQRGIAWLTRGSAADSLVCYCLRISDVCPIRFDLYFRRFLNQERMQLNKLPDIDVDFPHDRKDEVIDLIFDKYGTGQAAVVGGFSTFQARSAVGDVAKVLGVSEYQVRRFTEQFPYGGARGLEERFAESQECRDLPLAEEPYRTALRMAEFLDGFPRYPKMHPCGVVLSRQPMAELTPTFIANKGYPTTHYDMDAVEALGLVKIDVLAQGGLAVMRDVKQTLAARGVAIDVDGLEPWTDPQVWEMIAGGGGRAVHHIESPAMVGLCRQCNVRDIDGLIAIVSVIRPGAANEHKKQRFVRRYQGLEPPVYLDPCLEPYLKSTFGLVVYEEHILQICEVFAGMSPGRADILRRALSKHRQEVIDGIQREFFAAARSRGHAEERIAVVWELVSSFAGYAFCKAHSTAYGVEAYQSAWLKRYYPMEFMAAVLSNGKGFYHPLVYVLECHRLGLPLLPPWVNEPGPGFAVVPRVAQAILPADVAQASLPANVVSPSPPGSVAQASPPAIPTNFPAAENWQTGLSASPGQAIRVPATRVKGLTGRTAERLLQERARGEFTSLQDFYRRVAPMAEEMEALLRVGALDGFGKPRTTQFWEYRLLHQAYGSASEPGQGWLLPPSGADRLPEVPLQEPGRRERLEWETDLLGFSVSGHPLELHDQVAWDTYCPVSRLGEFVGQTVTTCGLVIEQRIHHQVTGEPMKFLTLADWTGMVETELFAPTYRSYGLATVRYPVLEITASVEPYDNQRGFSLRVQRAGKPRNAKEGLKT